MTTFYLILTIVFIILSIISAYTTSKGIYNNFNKGLFQTTLLVIVSIAFFIARENIIANANVINIFFDKTFSIVEKTFTQNTDAFYNLFGKGVDRAEFADMFGLMIIKVKELYLLIFPSLLVIGSLSLSFIIIMVIKNILLLFKKEVKCVPDFSDIRTKKTTIIAMVVFILLGNLIDGNLGIASINIFIVLLFTIAVSGFSLIDFWFRFKIPYFAVRLLIYVIAFSVAYLMFSFILSFLIIIGVMDSFKNFRCKAVL